MSSSVNSMEALLQWCSQIKLNILFIFSELFTIKNKNTEDHTGKVKSPVGGLISPYDKNKTFLLWHLVIDNVMWEKSN